MIIPLLDAFLLHFKHSRIDHPCFMKLNVCFEYEFDFEPYI